MRYNHFSTTCFWCKKEFEQRKDTYNRQFQKYGHSCCKHCFGKEKSFSEARTRVMLENNPFKGKCHTLETRAILANKKRGTVSWNKGLTKETNSIVKKYGEAVSKAKMGKHAGDKNPNWKGGKWATRRKEKFRADFKEWITLRSEIIKRDCGKCWKCQDTHRLEVHHIASRARYPELEFDEFNCVVLCHKCHIEFHKTYGRKRFKPTDTERFLNKGRSPEHFVVFH